MDPCTKARAHYKSLNVHPDVGAGARITVIDDVITRGATMLAAVARLKEAFPRATVQGFALIRTMSDKEIQAVKEPAKGVIRLVDWGTKREP